jgi:hypothetical protein
VSNAALRFQPTEAMRAEVRDKLQAMRSRGAGRRGNASASVSTAADSTAAGARRNGRAGAGRGADRGILWTVDGDGKLDIVPVRAGISNGQVTEITGGPMLAEGLQVIAAVTTSAATGIANPFENQQQPRGPGRGRVF